MKTTNYFDAFIEVAEDCPVRAAEVPTAKGNGKTAARIQYEMLCNNPYVYTSDDVVFHVFAERNDIPEHERPGERQKFFAKGQPCLRTSPLAKRYGWGIHSDSQGRVAIYPVESAEYQEFVARQDVKHVKAMRSKRG